MQPFYIGQEVVCIKNHIFNTTIKGNTYIIKNIYVKECGCGISLDLGILYSQKMKSECSKCTKLFGYDKIYWQNSNRFVPITSTFQSITLEKVLELETPFISVN